jgi:plastocyanin
MHLKNACECWFYKRPFLLSSSASISTLANPFFPFLRPLLSAYSHISSSKMRIHHMSFASLHLIAAAAGTTHDVQVGINGLAYTPNITTAAVGDTITFHFYPGGPGGHNVVQGSFDSPCTFLNGGFYSGFIITLTGESDNVFTITINDTNPIWIYCSEWMHCQLGMAMVINPP